MNIQPLTGWATAPASHAEERHAASMARLTAAASGTSHTVDDWIDVAAELAQSGMGLWQLRLIAQALASGGDAVGRDYLRTRPNAAGRPVAGSRSAEQGEREESGGLALQDRVNATLQSLEGIA